MASLKTQANASERAVLNTTISKPVLDAFKASCKQTGIQMNTILEAFMKQYCVGDFYLKFGKNNSIHVDLESVNESGISSNVDKYFE